MSAANYKIRFHGPGSKGCKMFRALWTRAGWFIDAGKVLVSLCKSMWLWQVPLLKDIYTPHFEMTREIQNCQSQKFKDNRYNMLVFFIVASSAGREVILTAVPYQNKVNYSDCDPQAMQMLLVGTEFCKLSQPGPSHILASVSQLSAVVCCLTLLWLTACVREKKWSSGLCK